MKKYISEFIGTFALTFIACGVAVVVGCNSPAGILCTSFAFGLVIVAMAYMIGDVSGCHINPAVSFALRLTGKMDSKELGYYVISQVLGACFGSLLLGLVLGSFKNLGANGFEGMLSNGHEVSMISAFIIEVILTFIFVSVILVVTSKKDNSKVSGIVIGLTLTLVHLIGISFTGTSVNPARSLAPALFQGGKALSQVWVFIFAPLCGCMLASLFYNKVICSEK